MKPSELVGQRYVDGLGSERTVPEATRAAFIAILAAADQGQIAPPVRVLREGEPFTVDVTLPAAAWIGDVLWTLSSSTQVLRAGTTPLRDAPVIGFAVRDGGTYDTRRLRIPAALPLGDFRLTLDIGSYGHAGVAVRVCPTRAYLPPGETRTWGLSVQIYTLRSARNWGIGDFGDLTAICTLAGDAGASWVGINPLHAAHRSDPEAASPYAPASRRFLNWLTIDVAALPEAATPAVRTLIEQLEPDLAALRATPLVDYTGVARVKALGLEACFAQLQGQRTAAFRTFVERGGVALRRFAIYEAIVARFGRNSEAWPPGLRDPQHADVAAFAGAEARAVDFGMYLQWCASEQLAATAQTAAEHGVRLYRDLAVGVEAHGADVWGDGSYVPSATVGAPPDMLNPLGQDWGLPPASPTALERDGYEGFAALLADNMRDAGALRIDHAMSLMRLFWIPRGASAVDGAYVAYPFDDLLAILARESVRARCVVIGEDLGAVPPGFRERMAQTNILSYRLLLFERDGDGRFLPAEQYPVPAIAVTGTHDLPPLAGWLAGEDIAIRERLGLFDPASALADRHERSYDVERLTAMLRANGDLREEAVAETIVAAAYRFLARTPARIVVLQLEDALGETTPVNVPGTDREYPNWRRKLRLDIGAIGSNPRFGKLVAALRELRPRT